MPPPQKPVARVVEAAGNSPNWSELSPIVDWGSPSAPHSPPEVPAPIPVPAVGANLNSSVTEFEESIADQKIGKVIPYSIPS